MTRFFEQNSKTKFSAKEIMKDRYYRIIKKKFFVILIISIFVTYFLEYITDFLSFIMFDFSNNNEIVTERDIIKLENWHYIAFFFLFFIYLYFLPIPFFFPKKNVSREAKAIRPLSAKEWQGHGPLLIFAPTQGIRLIFANEKDFRSRLEALSDRYGIFSEKVKSANAPPEFVAWVERIQERILDRAVEDTKSVAKDFESDIENALLPHPDSPIGAFILSEDDQDKGVELKLMALVMFYKHLGEFVEKEGGGFETTSLSSAQLKRELTRWLPDLKEGAEYRVLYELSLNSGRALAKIEQERHEISLLKEDLLQALQNARSTLELKPAANRWQRSARISGILAFIGLLPFLLLLFGVPWAIKQNWPEMSLWASTLFYAEDDRTREAIARLTKFFTDAPWATFVFVTVPVLLFAWTLKHFSRIFVQNMNLATDASRRAALADVYTRIVSDPNLNKDGSLITDEQKKIIFEAMFRPRDPRHTDDGIDYTQVEKIVKAVKDKDGK